MPKISSFEVRLISTITLRAAICFIRPMGSFSSMISTPWPMRSACPRSTDSADVEREILRFDQSHGDLAGVKRDVDLGIKAVQVIEHGHVLAEIVGRDVPVFRHHEIESDEMRIGRGQFEAENDLGEYGFTGESAQYLVKVSDGDVASGFGFWRCRISLREWARAFIVRPESYSYWWLRFFQSARQDFFAHLGEIVVPADFCAEFRSGTASRRCACTRCTARVP